MRSMSEDGIVQVSLLYVLSDKLYLHYLELQESCDLDHCTAYRKWSCFIQGYGSVELARRMKEGRKNSIFDITWLAM